MDHVSDEALDADELDADDIEDDDLEVDLDEELDADDIEDIGDGIDDDIAPIDDDETADVTDEADDVPRARARPGSEEDEDDDVNPDDIEADLDSILKDKIASSDDEDDDEDDEGPDSSGGSSERITAKAADEFTCDTCFLIVHPRQFGRLGSLSCPEGYDPCPSIAKVEKVLKRSKKP
ncbi:MAG: hypothetical protein M5U19_05440 [Microthrixaceae bacterium]|nr:hypothetical protein [Microthrixaceae bacterium]